MSIKLTDADVQLLERTKTDLMENPGAFNMNSWRTCIAGRMSAIETGSYEPTYIAMLRSTFESLFTFERWPVGAQHAYLSACRPATRAAAGIAAIDAFLTRHLYLAPQLKAPEVAPEVAVVAEPLQRANFVSTRVRVMVARAVHTIHGVLGLF